MTWLLTYVTSEPWDAVIWITAGLFAVVAIVCTVKVGRELRELFREYDDAPDWCREQTERRW